MTSSTVSSSQSWAIVLHAKTIEEQRRVREATHSFEQHKSEVELFPFADSLHWCQFVENLQNRSKKIPMPFWAVKSLGEQYLQTSLSDLPILDIGCETGKNALCLIQGKQKVTLLDIAPNAIKYTVENLRKEKMSEGIQNAIVGKIENLDPCLGPFKAVVGTYAFPFIPPELFQKVMKKNVLGRIEPGGYFVGGFFGPEHQWANDPSLTIMSLEKIKKFFSSLNFSILKMVEEKTETSTVLHGQQFFHTVELIAKKEK